jgi:NAD(P)-dependent dehydrogenase (short-subunit alcohol dehydrogenase family)
MDISGNIAVITGGVSGLGAATARRLIDLGATAALLDVNEERGAAVDRELGDKALFIKTDVAETDQVEAAFGKIMERFGAVHFMINCAGVSLPRRTVNRDGPYPMDTWSKIVSINLLGSYDCARWAAYHMQSNEPNEDGERGVIVNTSSAAAFDGQIGQTPYSASKAGLVGLTLPLARDLAVIGVRVCTIAPGTFDTPMMALAPQELWDSLRSQTPFPKRAGKPEEFASLVEQIITNPMLNGETIRIDAGMRTGPT